MALLAMAGTRSALKSQHQRAKDHCSIKFCINRKLYRRSSSLPHPSSFTVLYAASSAAFHALDASLLSHESTGSPLLFRRAYHSSNAVTTYPPALRRGLHHRINPQWPTFSSFASPRFSTPSFNQHAQSEAMHSAPGGVLTSAVVASCSLLCADWLSSTIPPWR